MHSPHRRFSRQLIWIGLLLAVASPVWGTYRITESSLAFGRFGTVVLYSPPAEPDQVVLFISGDGGWNLGVVDMARELAGLDALVVGIDIRHFLKSVETGQGQCAYPAADFESMGQFVQKRLGYRTFHRPVLLGYSSGATLAYATLAQAPAGTFSGAASLGFCPDLMLHKPTCKGAGLATRPTRSWARSSIPLPGWLIPGWRCRATRTRSARRAQPPLSSIK